MRCHSNVQNMLHISDNLPAISFMQSYPLKWKKCSFLNHSTFSYFSFTGGMFRNAEFHCRVRRHNRQLVGYRLAIRWVQNELACAIDCLIYGSGCESYNYKHNHDLASNDQNICELNSSNQHKHPSSLLSSIGFQYCERVS